MKYILCISLFSVSFLFGCDSEPNTLIEEISSPSGSHSMYPRLYTDNTGTNFMSWMEQSGQTTILKYASWNNDSWSEPETIAADSTWFVNWADFPSIIAQNGKPVAAHWLNKIPGGTYAYEINMSVFEGGWSSTFTPHQDKTPTEHGFVSMLPASDSTFMAVWLDGRNTAGRSHDQYSDTTKAMSLRGALIHRSGNILQKYMLDPSVCDCCNTAIAKTSSGFIVAYRNRTSEEIRDIYTVTIKNDGQVTTPVPVHQDNWKINACPVNGPALATKGNHVALVWFTGSDEQSQVKLSISTNEGGSYTNPILVDKQTKGRVEVEIAHNKIWISRLSFHNGQEVLKISTYTLKGNWVEDYIFEDITTDRGSGFPQITPSKKGILIAYTNSSEDGKMIQVKEISENN